MGYISCLLYCLKIFNHRFFYFYKRQYFYPINYYSYFVIFPRKFKKVCKSVCKSQNVCPRTKQSQTGVKYSGIIICIKINTYVNKSDLIILHKKNVQIRLIFQTLSSISPNFHVVCLQPNSWLESYDRYGSFGTMIWGLLIVIPVPWFLSSRNTLSVTHSDTASYAEEQEEENTCQKKSYDMSWLFN